MAKPLSTELKWFLLTVPICYALLCVSAVVYHREGWEAVYWLLWVAAFLAVEIPSIFNARKGDTFSEVWWRFFRIKGGLDKHGNQMRPLPLALGIPIHVGIVAFGVWLIGHLGFGLWGG